MFGRVSTSGTTLLSSRHRHGFSHSWPWISSRKPPAPSSSSCMISTLALSCFASNFMLSEFYFSLPSIPETDRFFRGYQRAGKTIGYTLLFFGNVGLYYFTEKSIACMLTFLFLAFYCLCAFFCIQPYTDFGALEFLLSACMNQTLSLFGLRSSSSWLVIIACIVIAGIRFCLEPAEATTDEVDLESGRRNT
ncbi:hypothetical protein C3L33_20046, partial [Rhododendron williamsianum]